VRKPRNALSADLNRPVDSVADVDPRRRLPIKNVHLDDQFAGARTADDRHVDRRTPVSHNALVFSGMVGDAPSRALSFFVHGDKVTRVDDIRGRPVDTGTATAE